MLSSTVRPLASRKNELMRLFAVPCGSVSNPSPYCSPAALPPNFVSVPAIDSPSVLPILPSCASDVSGVNSRSPVVLKLPPPFGPPRSPPKIAATATAAIAAHPHTGIAVSADTSPLPAPVNPTPTPPTVSDRPSSEPSPLVANDVAAPPMPWPAPNRLPSVPNPFSPDAAPDPGTASPSAPPAAPTAPENPAWMIGRRIMLLNMPFIESRKVSKKPLPASAARNRESLRLWLI